MVYKIRKARKLQGSTDPLESTPGTIRFQFGKDKTRNSIHVSEDSNAFQKEFKILKKYFSFTCPRKCDCNC